MFEAFYSGFAVFEGHAADVADGFVAFGVAEEFDEVKHFDLVERVLVLIAAVGRAWDLRIGKRRLSCHLAGFLSMF